MLDHLFLYGDHITNKSYDYLDQAAIYGLKFIKIMGGPRGRVVKVADFSALDHSIISPMRVRALHGARIHM